MSYHLVECSALGSASLGLLRLGGCNSLLVLLPSRSKPARLMQASDNVCYCRLTPLGIGPLAGFNAALHL